MTNPCILCLLNFTLLIIWIFLIEFKQSPIYSWIIHLDIANPLGKQTNPKIFFSWIFFYKIYSVYNLGLPVAINSTLKLLLLPPLATNTYLLWAELVATHKFHWSADVHFKHTPLHTSSWYFLMLSRLSKR